MVLGLAGLVGRLASSPPAEYNSALQSCQVQLGAPLEGAEVVADEVVEGEAGALEGAEFGGDEVDGDLPKVGAEAAFVAKALAHVAADDEFAVFAGDAAAYVNSARGFEHERDVASKAR